MIMWDVNRERTRQAVHENCLHYWLFACKCKTDNLMDSNLLNTLSLNQQVFFLLSNNRGKVNQNNYIKEAHSVEISRIKCAFYKSLRIKGLSILVASRLSSEKWLLSHLDTLCSLSCPIWRLWENRLYQTILWPSHICHNMGKPTHFTHTCTRLHSENNNVHYYNTFYVHNIIK